MKFDKNFKISLGTKNLKFHIRTRIKQLLVDVKNEKLSYFVDGMINSTRKWSYSRSQKLDQSNGQTSISDYSEYSDFCGVASKSDSIFRKFRSCSEYQVILEHMSREQGKSYLNEIVKDNLFENQVIRQLSSDEIGKPIKFRYKGIGRVSPTQLRYTKVMSDLLKAFGDLSDFRIVEVGIGYGGQASQITNMYKIANYTLVDLPTVLNLATKYLKLRSPHGPFSLGGESGSNNSLFDLFISNYAFSELKREIQDSYFENFVKNAKRGYVIYNPITPTEWGSMTATEFASKIPGAEIFEEIPNTGAGNVLVLWGHKREGSN